jgi:ligand-binding sensor domain-containing protein
MHPTRSFTLFLVFICGWFAGNTQTPPLPADLRFENYNARNHFINQYIQSVTRDKKGYIWAACNGVIKFDGYQYTPFTNFNNQHHGLLDNYVDEVVVDQQDRVWVGTARELAWYDPQKDQFIRPHTDSSQRIDYAFRLRVHNNILWFISNLGLAGVDLSTNKVFTTSLQRVFDPTGIFPLNDHTLWINSVTHGSFIYDVRTDRYKKIALKKDGVLLHIWSVKPWGNKIIIATNKGLWQTPSVDEPAVPISNAGHYNINDALFYPALTGDSVLWLATFDRGIVLFDLTRNQELQSLVYDPSNPFSLQANNISKLYLDASNLLWVGTEAGLSLLNPYNQSSPKTHLFLFNDAKLTDNYIVNIIQDPVAPEIAWILCLGQGLLKFNWKSKKILAQYKKIGNQLIDSWPEAVYDMVKLANHNWLLVRKNGLLLWNEQDGTSANGVLHLLPGKFNFKDAIPAGEGIVYLASQKGLYRYNSDKKEIIPAFAPAREQDNLFSGALHNGLYDQEHRMVWASSQRGLVGYNEATGKTQVFINKTSTDTTYANFIFHVSQDDKGLIWCSTRNGVSIFDPSKATFRNIETFDNNRNPQCFGSMVQYPHAFISSNAGLIDYDIVTQQSRIIAANNPYTEEYSTVPPFRINEELIAGFRNSFSYFNMVESVNTPSTSIPLIESVQVNALPYPLSEVSTSLNYKQNILRFTFTAFDYSNPSGIRFRYKLAGLEKDWNTATSRTATYYELLPGTYTFQVQAANSKGYWNQEAATYTFTIVPPYWQTWWFRAAVLSLFIGVVVVIAGWRVSVIKREEKRKTGMNRELAELEMKALRSQMNPHFIFNSLNSIQKYIWENNQDDASEYLTRFARLIRLVLENSRQKLIPLSSELNALKLYLELEHRRMNQRFDYHVKVDEDIPTDTVKIPPLLLQPYVENAIWHGLSEKEERGSLDIRITQKNNLLYCIIQDNGIGRKAAQEKRGTPKQPSLAMNISSERVKWLQKENNPAFVEIHDNYEGVKPVGTTVILNLPLILAHD